MATLSSDKVATNLPRRSIHAGAFTEVAQFTGAAALSAGDVVQMVKVPAGARVVDLVYATNVLSQSVSAAISFGDGIDPNRYSSAGGLSNITGVLGDGLANAVTAVGYEYSADDTVDVTVGAAGGDATSAPIIRAYVTMVVDN